MFARSSIRPTVQSHLVVINVKPFCVSVRVNLVNLTQACTRVFQRRRGFWRCRLRCTTLLAAVPGSNSARTPDRRNRRCCRPRHPSIPARSPMSAPRKWTGGPRAFSWWAEAPRIQDTVFCRPIELHAKRENTWNFLTSFLIEFNLIFNWEKNKGCTTDLKIEDLYVDIHLCKCLYFDPFFTN